jgi:hypothetical protein
MNRGNEPSRYGDPIRAENSSARSTQVAREAWQPVCQACNVLIPLTAVQNNRFPFVWPARHVFRTCLSDFRAKSQQRTNLQIRTMRVSRLVSPVDPPYRGRNGGTTPVTFSGTRYRLSTAVMASAWASTPHQARFDGRFGSAMMPRSLPPGSNTHTPSATAT